MQTVTINGTTYDGTVIADGTRLFVYLTGVSLIDGFEIFKDPAKLYVITVNSYEHERTYKGFTKLTAINGEFGNCNATLERA